MTQNHTPMNFMRSEKVDHNKKLLEQLAMGDLLEKSLVTAREAEEEKRYADRPKSLGAGRVGHPLAPVPYERGCERALFYEMKRYKSESPFPDNLYRVFSMGHAAEEIVAENLRLAGFNLITADEKGNQYGFALSPDPNTGHPRFKGFCDGVFIDGPAFIGREEDGLRLVYPFLWENKAVNDKKFKKFRDEGVERSHPYYYSQLQIYMNFLNLWQRPAMITFLNRETGEIACEFVHYNAKHCQAIIDRAARVIEAQGPLVLARAANEYEKMPCKFCSYRNQCQQDEANRTPHGAADFQETPEWMKQGD